MTDYHSIFSSCLLNFLKKYTIFKRVAYYFNFPPPAVCSGHKINPRDLH